MAPIAVSAWLYAAGSPRAEGLTRWEKACVWSGWASLMIALMSPLHPMGESLFSAHMAQHEIIMVLSAPLLVLGRPLVAFLWALPPAARRSVGSLGKAAWIPHPWEYLTRPLVAFAIHFAAVWVWHLPAAYDASVTSDAVHTAQHASFLGSALLFWWAAIRQHIARKHYGPRLFYS